MFFHTHVYYTKKIDKELDPLTIVGSFLPDLSFTGGISWDDLHKKKNILNFFEFIKKNYPEYNSLLKGITYHNTLDYYTHITYKHITPGYAYTVIPAKLPSLLEKVSGITPQRSKNLSHNFIESGVEYYLLHDEPELAGLVKRSIEQLDKEKLADILATFYKRDKKVMLEALNKFFYLATAYDFSIFDSWITFWTDLRKFYLGNTGVQQKTVELRVVLKKLQEKYKEFFAFVICFVALKLAFKETKGTYREFLAYAISSQNREIKDAN